jgi:hypothetical protein
LALSIPALKYGDFRAFFIKVSLDYIYSVLTQNKDLPLIARSTYYKVINAKDKAVKKPKFFDRLKIIIKDAMVIAV